VDVSHKPNYLNSLSLTTRNKAINFIFKKPPTKKEEEKYVETMHDLFIKPLTKGSKPLVYKKN
jgi:N-dimethylarginine dimethylaminohydrolase